MKTIEIQYPITLTWLDYPDNESQAIIIYFLGCSHNCKNCHNIEIANSISDNKKELITTEIIVELLRLKREYNTNKLVFSGGDPLYKKNIEFIKHLINYIQFSFDICIYTGHTINYVKKEGISGFKFLKTGKYKEELKQESFKNDEGIQFASSNQKLYDEKYHLISKNGLYIFKN